MFFREKMIRGSRAVQLVESFRNEEGKPRQRVLASLGDAAIPEPEFKAIARAVELRLRRQDSLFPVELSSEAAAWVVRIVRIAEKNRSVPLKPGTTHLDGVIVDRIQIDDVVGFGPHLIGLGAWNALGLSTILKKQGMSEERIGLCQIMVVNRLIEPLSEWALAEWANRTALPEMLGVEISRTTKDRLYKTSDELLG